MGLGGGRKDFLEVLLEVARIIDREAYEKGDGTEITKILRS